MSQIYLDYMATTPVDPQIAKKMSNYLCLDGCFGNPASINHPFGQAARAAVEHARGQVAELVGASARDIIWTSGATESNNLAIIGAVDFYQARGRHVITLKTEHKSVLDCMSHLASKGYEISYLTPQANGLLAIESLIEAIRPDTVLVSIMHVNNEIGVIQDIKAIGEVLRAKGILFHVDGAQSAGKLPINLAETCVDLMSFSAHKVYGPKGIGALYVRSNPKLRLSPLIHGGGQERGFRSGTLPTHQIVAMGEAFAMAQANMNDADAHIRTLRQRFIDGLNALGGVQFNGDMGVRLAGNINVCFDGVEGSAIQLALRDIACSSASACSADTIAPSHVLQAIGLSDEAAHSSIRFSIGRFTTGEEIEHALSIITTQLRRLRQIAPKRIGDTDE